MKKLILSTLIVFQSLISYSQLENAKRFAKTITEKDLKKHLYTYASDEFEGRNTGSEGQKKLLNI